jgi:hypothetical protein
MVALQRCEPLRFLSDDYQRGLHHLAAARGSRARGIRSLRAARWTNQVTEVRDQAPCADAYAFEAVRMRRRPKQNSGALGSILGTDPLDGFLSSDRLDCPSQFASGPTSERWESGKAEGLSVPLALRHHPRPSPDWFAGVTKPRGTRLDARH